MLKLHSLTWTDNSEPADKNFTLLKQDPRHPSLHFKRLMGDVGVRWTEPSAFGHRGEGRLPMVLDR
jgi:hypothetical protein